MIVYLAGGVSGNLNPLWKLFLAGQKMDITQKLEESMKQFLTGQNGKTEILKGVLDESIPSREWWLTESIYDKHYQKVGSGYP